VDVGISGYFVLL